MWPLLTVATPHTRHETLLYRDPLPPLVTSGGKDWKPVQTCSLEETHPQNLVLTSGGY